MRITSNELGIQAYQAVKAMILSRELKPGEKIIQDKLAEELGISRTPLRSALEKLEAESLVESLPRRGMIVKTLTPNEIIEIYECRMALEETAIKLICEKDASSFVEQAKSLFAPFQNKSTFSQKEYQEADLKFHELIISSCGNTRLHKIFMLGNLLNAIDQIGLVRSSQETLVEHNLIIDAVASKNAEKAAQFMHDHLAHSKKLIKNQHKGG